MTLGKSSAERQALASAWITPVLLRRHFEISNTMVIMIMSSLGVTVQSNWSSSAERPPKGDLGASMKSWISLQRSDTNCLSSGVLVHWILICGVFICVMFYGREIGFPPWLIIIVRYRLSQVMRAGLLHWRCHWFGHRKENWGVYLVGIRECNDRLMPGILQ